MLGQQSYSQIAFAPALEIIAQVCGQDLADHLLGATNAKLPKTELEAALKASGLRGAELKQVLAVLNEEFDRQGALVRATREVMQPAEKVIKQDEHGFVFGLLPHAGHVAQVEQPVLVAEAWRDLLRAGATR